MTGTGYPVAPVAPAAAAVVEPRVLTPEEQEQVDTLYEDLKPEATETARNYVLSRTPANLQEAMAAKIEADWPAPVGMTAEEAASRAADLLSYSRRGTAPAAPVPADPPAGTVAQPVA